MNKNKEPKTSIWLENLTFGVFEIGLSILGQIDDFSRKRPDWLENYIFDSKTTISNENMQFGLKMTFWPENNTFDRN